MAAREHIKVLQAYTINCFDLDDKVLSPEFPQWQHGDFVAAKEASNGVYVEVTVAYGNDQYGQEELDEYLKSGEVDYGVPDVLLSNMCGRGLIDAGLYLIHVFW